MVTIRDLRRWVTSVLDGQGLEGQNSSWRLIGDEVQWVLLLDGRANYLEILIGVDLQVTTRPRAPNHCAIYLPLMNLRGIFTLEEENYRDGFNLNIEMDRSLRQEKVTSVVERGIAYMKEHMEATAIRAAYKAGDLRSAIILRDVRTFLES